MSWYEVVRACGHCEEVWVEPQPGFNIEDLFEACERRLCEECRLTEAAGKTG